MEIHHLGNQRSSCVMSRVEVWFSACTVYYKRGEGDTCGGRGACANQSMCACVRVCVLCVSAVKKRGEGMSSQAAVAANSNPARSSI